MSKCNFSIDFSGQADALVQKAEAAIIKAGGKFNGDTESGGFIIPTPIGQVSGAYGIENQSFNIQIENKPLFITCNKLETELRRYVEAG